MAGVRLGRGTPDVLALTPLGEELGDLGVVLVRRGRLQVLAGLLLERGLDLRIIEEVGPVEIDFDEGFHGDAEEVAVGILEVVGEGGEGFLREVRRLQRRVIGQRLGDIDEEVPRQVGVDDVLLDVDHVIDAGAGFHVLDRLVVHLVPGGRLDLDLDPGLRLELGREHVLDVVRGRSALGHAMQRDTLKLRACVRPEVGAGGHGSGQEPDQEGRHARLEFMSHLFPPVGLQAATGPGVASRLPLIRAMTAGCAAAPAMSVASGPSAGLADPLLADNNLLRSAQNQLIMPQRNILARKCVTRLCAAP